MSSITKKSNPQGEDTYALNIIDGDWRAYFDDQARLYNAGVRDRSLLKIIGAVCVLAHPKVAREMGAGDEYEKVIQYIIDRAAALNS